MRLAVGAVGGFLFLLFAVVVAAVGGVNNENSVSTQAAAATTYPSSTRVNNDPSKDPFPWGECTYYVWLHAHVTWNGDAYQWLTNAQAQGYATTPYPVAGAIVVFSRGGPYDHQFGHVAIVEAVSPTDYTISEMNNSALGGLGIVDQRTIAWPDPYVQGFVES